MSEQTAKQRLATYTKRLASQFKQNDDTISPTELAKIVDRDPKTVRAYLRKAHPRTIDNKNRPWSVDKATAASTAAHFASAARGPEGSPWYDQKAVTDRAIHLHSESEETLTMEWLVEETLWDESRLEEVLEAMTTTRQVVLAGPPGTGKTWVAERIARYLASGNPLAVRTVQFHPSYGYEEFIEGLRPAMNDQGALVFDVQPGVVRTMVDQIDNPAQNYVLVIDEMNRANLPRVFGELMYLFEYRDKPIDLQYTSDFTLPENLSFIGTMNTADRSIRSIDIALRRRFDVFECPPEPEILDRYYAHPDRQNAVVDDLVDGFVTLNARLEEHLDRHHSIGHTFFMNDSFTHKRLKQVWDRQLKPLIEEYFFDQPDIASEYEVGAFWQVDG